jgi:hypothetical protein
MHTRRMRANCDPRETDESIIRAKVLKAPAEIQDRYNNFYHATPDKPTIYGYRGYHGYRGQMGDD